MSETSQEAINTPEAAVPAGAAPKAPHDVVMQAGVANAHARQGKQHIGLDISLLGSVLALALLLRLWHLSAITDNYDEGVYWASLRALHDGNGLFDPIFSSQPPFFLLALVPLESLLGPTLLAGRLSIVLFSLLGVLAMYLLGRRLGGRWAGFGAALLLAVDHLYLLQSQSIQAEVPATALMIVALAAASFTDRFPWRASLIAGIATMLAILTKLFAVVAVVPILLLLLGQGIPAARRSQRVRALQFGLPTIGIYLLGMVAAGMLVLLPYLDRLQPLYQQVIAFHLDAASAFPGSLLQNLALIIHTQAEYPLFLMALLGGIIGLWRRQWSVIVALFWALAALVLLFQQAPLFDHHLVLLVPGLALTAALGLAPHAQPGLNTALSGAARLAAPLQRWLALFSARGTTVLRYGLPALLLGSVVLFALNTNLRYPIGLPADQAATLSAVASDLKALTKPDQYVLADDQYLANMAERSVPPELVDTSFVRIATGYLTTAQVIALAELPQMGAILFYSGRFDQLAGFRAWVEGHFHLARDYGHGKAIFLPGPPINTADSEIGPL